MNFMWSGLLALLVALPVLIGIYIWSLRRRRPSGVRYSSLSLIRDADAGVGAPAPPSAVRPLRRRARRPRPRPGPAGRHPGRTDEPDHDHPHHRRLRQHVLVRHPAQPPRGGRGGRGQLHQQPGCVDEDRHRRLQHLRARSSRRPRTIDRRCSTRCTAWRPGGGRPSATASWPRSTPSRRSTRPWPRA